jgi:hypothetical protein
MICGLVAQTHNISLKLFKEFADSKKKTHIKTGKRFSTKCLRFNHKNGGRMRDYW